ncbi:hypothetical protein [Sphingobium yanoikuyae]|uniref:hypothetical protein n=1 Tax=Sphingobium yanoikuyae TaxID=13690 RepID=UPI000A42A6B9|nr:hypothetical protein [Sphingobium yanoikuyae]
MTEIIRALIRLIRIALRLIMGVYMLAASRSFHWATWQHRRKSVPRLAFAADHPPAAWAAP